MVNQNDNPSVPESADPGSRERLVALYRQSLLGGADTPADSFLRENGNPDSSSILEALLAVEVQSRRDRGQPATVDFFQKRYPDKQDLVAEVMQSLSLKKGDDAEDIETDPNLVETIAGSHSRDKNSASDTAFTVVQGPLTGPDANFGDYVLLNEIARGGMGIVYRARQTTLNRIVALKMIKTGQLASDDELLRFQSEAEAAAQLDHPNIVPVFEVGEQDGRQFFSMGFIDGDSLSDRLKDGPMSPRKAAELLRTLAEAVRFAHEKGIVHRDLKPANVLIDLQGQPKITDFGLAKRAETDSALTATGQIVGTPSFMPPEQAAGAIEDIGPPADIYSLGAMLYCMLTGRPPFHAANVMETLKQVLERDPVPPRQLNSAVDRDLETICLRCLEKEPARRYASAAALADDLGRYLDGQPIHARPIGRVAKLWRTCKRYPLASTLIVLLVVALTATGFIFAGMRDANARLREEELNRNLADEQRRRSDAEKRTAESLRVAAERENRAQRYSAIMRGITMRRFAAKPGWTWKNEEDLRRARAIDTPLRSAVELRTESFAARTSFDVRIGPEIPIPVRTFCVAFSPSSKQLAIGQFKAGLQGLFPIGIYVRDLESGSMRKFNIPAAFHVRHKGGIVQDGARSLTWSPDGAFVYVGMRSGRIARLDTLGGRKPLIWQAHAATVSRLAAHPNGKHLYSCADEKAVHCWDVTKLVPPKNAGLFNRAKVPELVNSFQRQDTGDYGMALSKDGKYLAVGDGRAGILTTPTMTQIASHDLDDPAFSQYGNWYFAFDHKAFGIKILDGVSGRLRDRVPIIGRSEHGVRRVLFHPSETVACLLRQPQSERAMQYLEFRDLATGAKLLTIPADRMVKPVFSPNGRMIATPTIEGVRIHQIRGFDERTWLTRAAPHSTRIQAVAVSPVDGRLATIGGPVLKRDGTVAGHAVTVWDGGNPVKRVRSWTYPEDISQSRSQLEFDRSGQRLVVSRLWHRSDLLIYDARTGQRVRSFSKVNVAPRRFSLTSRGHLWVSLAKNDEHVVRCYDETGKRLFQFHDGWARTRGGERTVPCVAAGRRWVVAGCANGVILTASAADGRGIGRLSPGIGYIAAVAQHDGAKPWFAAGSNDGTVVVREFGPDGEFVKLHGHSGPVSSIAISSDGRWIASGSRDQSINLWKRDADGWSTYLKLDTRGPVDTVAFTHDDASLAVLIEGERTVRMYRLKQAKLQFAKWSID